MMILGPWARTKAPPAIAPVHPPSVATCDMRTVVTLAVQSADTQERITGPSRAAFMHLIDPLLTLVVADAIGPVLHAVFIQRHDFVKAHRRQDARANLSSVRSLHPFTIAASSICKLAQRTRVPRETIVAACVALNAVPLYAAYTAAGTTAAVLSTDAICQGVQ